MKLEEKSATNGTFAGTEGMNGNSTPEEEKNQQASEG
jgi:hypothetical protein